MNSNDDLLARAVDLVVDGQDLDDYAEIAAAVAADPQLQAAIQQYRELAEELRADDESRNDESRAQAAVPTGGFAAFSQRLESAIRAATAEPSAATAIAAPLAISVPLASAAPSAPSRTPGWAVAATIALAAAGWTLYLANLAPTGESPAEPTTLATETAPAADERRAAAERIAAIAKQSEAAERRSRAATAALAQQSAAIIKSLSALRDELGEVARQVENNSQQFEQQRGEDDSLVAQLARALGESPGGREAAKRFEFVLANDARIEQAIEEGVDGEAYRILLGTLETYRAILQVAANNLANADTIGFKRDRVVLADIGYRTSERADTMDMQEAANSIAVGLGSRVAKHEIDFSQGVVVPSRRELDLAIEGGGLFSLVDNAGRLWYSRAGNLVVDAAGRLAWQNDQAALALSPEILVPQDAIRIIVRRDGSVEAATSDQFEPTAIGQIQLARFANSAALKKAGKNLYEAPAEAGAVTLAAPGSAGLGFIQQFALEQSNVDPQLEKLDFERAVRTIRVLRQLLRKT